MFENINRKYLIDDGSEPWNADYVNLTLHKLNNMLSVAVRRNTTAFASAVCKTLHNDPRASTLPAYLLALQLFTDKDILRHTAKTNNNSACSEVLDFVQKYHTLLDDTLDCLNSTHVVQQKWNRDRKVTRSVRT